MMTMEVTMNKQYGAKKLLFSIFFLICMLSAYLIGSPTHRTYFVESDTKLEISKIQFGKDSHFHALLKNRAGDEIACLNFRFNKNMQHSCFIIELETYPAYRRQGHATRMLEYIFKLMRSFDVKKISLLVDHTNTQARELYTKLGFKYVNHLNELLMVLEKDLSVMQ